MKQLIYWLLPFLLLWGSQAARASHIIGADVSYRCMGGNQYEVTLRLFRDCDGLNVGLNETVTIQGLGSCNTLSQTLDLEQIYRDELPLVCGATTCNGSSSPGYEEIIYTGIVDLSAYTASSCGWTISYTNCCTSANITNLTASGSIYVETSRLPNSGVLCNSSPITESNPVFLLCNNNRHNISTVMTDPDGDSVSYALAQPTNLSYTTGFSAIQPLTTTSGGFQFDTRTGQASFTPTGNGQGTIVDVVASEYRNGVLIGQTRRTLQITTLNCPGSNSITLDQVEQFDNGNWVSQGTNTTFKTCLGSSIRFRANFSSTSSNSFNAIDIIDAYTSLQRVYPLASLTSTPGPTNSQLAVEVTLPVTQFGSFTTGIANNNCAVRTISTFGFNVEPDSSCAQLSGIAFLDTNSNCSQDIGEVNYNRYSLRLTKGNTIITLPADGQGGYTTYIDTGTYQLNLSSSSPYHQLCPAVATGLTILPNTGNNILDLPIQTTAYCPYMIVDIGAPVLVHCTDNYYTVHYSNLGTTTARNAQIVVTLDPLFVVDSTTYPLDSQSINSYYFNFPSIGTSQSGTFYIYGQLDTACDISLMGQTFCATAQITPDTICGLWSGPNLEVEGICNGDSVSFRIINNGDQIMGLPESYWVIEDNIILHTGPAISLNVGAATPWFSFYANGSTYRTEINQTTSNPWNRKASATVTGCISSNTSGPPITGMSNLFSLNDGLPSISIDCQVSVAAYDPNDKQSFPIGYGLDHYIERNTDLEYRIRFQNTGTFFATDVVIRDTLSPHLDAFSVQPQVSSHAYTWRLLEDNILEFTFDNIMLPDSGRDMLGSRGFIDFRVKQKPNLPLTTRIENTAAIYFDRNPPIFTNTTWHTIGENFIRMAGLPTVASEDETTHITAFPNPFVQATTIRVQGTTTYQDLQLEVYDAMGRLVYQTHNQQGTQEVYFQRQDLSSGIYFYRLIADERTLHSGKLTAQ